MTEDNNPSPDSKGLDDDERRLIDGIRANYAAGHAGETLSYVEVEILISTIDRLLANENPSLGPRYVAPLSVYIGGMEIQAANDYRVLPCPFCGSAPELHISPTDRYSGARVICSRVTECAGGDTPSFGGEKHSDPTGSLAAVIAIDKWNGRAQNPPPATQVMGSKMLWETDADNAAAGARAVRDILDGKDSPSPLLGGFQPPEDCDGEEQLAFEAWAKLERYDMHEHPIHYLFLDPKTYAARQGWKAALNYVRALHALSATAPEGE